MINENKIGMFSLAGKESRGKYNILKSFNKIKPNKRNTISRGFSYYPDKEFFNQLKGKDEINTEEILKGANFDINEIRKAIKNNNIYYKGEEKNVTPNMNETKNKNLLKTNYSEENKKIELMSKTQLFKGRKYKYYNEHIQRINRYKKEGIFKKILSQQETSYSPRFDYIHKRIFTGPKWNKLTGRKNLFEPAKNKQKMNLSISSEKEISKRIKKITERNLKKNNYLIKAKTAFSIKCINSMTKTQLTTNKNNKTNFTTNEFYSYLENTDKNNIIQPSDSKRKFLSILKLKPNNRTLKINTLRNKKNDTSIKKRDHIPGLEFNRYLDLEKIERKKKRLQKVAISKIIYVPNYSYVEGNIKSFVNYNIKKNTLNKKPKEFNGINASEFIYDPSSTFEKIYGYKMKSAPKFQQTVERPDDINLPTYMKGFYSRMGIEFSNEKTLKMNNYENAKIYRSQSNFEQPKNKYNSLRKVCYEGDKVLDVSKIKQDFDSIKKKFDNIKIINYD